MQNRFKINFLKINVIFITLFLIITSYSAFSLSTEKNEKNYLFYQIDFEKPVIQKEITGDIIYYTVKMKNTDVYGDIGEPLLPAKEIRLLLPYETKLKSISVVTSERKFLENNIFVLPGSQPVQISKINQVNLPKPNIDIYNSNAIYPEKKFTNIGTQCFRGYNILYLILHPVQYEPLSGNLYYFENMKINIEIEKSKDQNSLFRGLKNDENEIITKIDNPEIAKSYICKNQINKIYDLLILTTESLKKGFYSLSDVHNNTGINTVIKTLTDIGSNDPKSIRNYIRYAYSNWGIDYVLIGGDYDIVPARDLWVNSYLGGPSDNMPSDLYYSCLDGTYNYDGDDRWGEPFDGDGRGEVDLVAEVYIGRACVENRFEIDNFVYKTVSYIYNKHNYLNEVLLVGEYLWGPPDFENKTWGGDYMDELIDYSDTNGYLTVGIPSVKYNIETLYDREYTNNYWPKKEIINQINNNIHIINHLGHSWYNYNMKMYNDDLTSLTNNQFCFIYSQGCDAGGFDNPYGYDCIAEYFTVKNSHGAFAGIWNARSGFGSGISTDGSSQRFNREFWDAIFKEDIHEIGRANQDSKEDNLYRVKQPCMRWCYYQLNLFGDPTIDFFTHYNNNPPEKSSTPSGQSSGEVGIAYTFKVEGVEDPDGDDLYYKFDWGDDSYCEWLGPFNSETEEIYASHVWEYNGQYNITVKVRDNYWSVSEWSNPFKINIEGPFLEIKSIRGGLLGVSAEIENIGNGYACNIKRSISISSVSDNKIFIITNSSINYLESGDITIASTDKPAIGFGKVSITASASAPGINKVSKKINGYIFLFYVFITK